MPKVDVFKSQLFDTESKAGKRYIKYMKNRNRIWADKYINNRKVRYKGNEILRNCHFCNIWREQDKFSKEEIKRIRGKSLLDQIIIISIARLTLSWETTDLLMSGAGKKEIYEHWENCKETEGKTFVSNAVSMYPRAGSDRALDIIDHRDDVFKYAEELEKSINKAHNALYLFSKIPVLYKHIGVFRAYEIYTSLTYSEHIDFKEDDAFLVGIGAIDGLTYLTGTKYNNTDCNAVLVDLLEEVREYFINTNRFIWIPEDMQGSVNNKEKYKFTVRTLEDSLCEFRKYTNLVNNIGKRRKYKK